MTTPSLEERLEEFESAWQRCPPVDLAYFWSLFEAGIPPDDRLKWLHEFIKVDLEYRWSRSTGVRLEEYAAIFPELGPAAGWPLDLIVEEWRARERFGGQPRFDEYRRRFPMRTGLESELSAVRQELSREWQEPAAAPTPTATPARCDPRAPLDYRDFTLKEMIGSGGMGKVYRAWQKSLQRNVAVKMLRKARWTIAGAVERFLEEARVIGRLQHPGIVGMRGVGQTPGGGLFIVMDFIEGCNLAEATTEARPSPRQAACWIAEAATALDYAHKQGVVHCDLKPSNLLREDSGRILLSDFGLATSMTAPAGSHQWAGTNGFMAPEQLDSRFGKIEPATDVFALGLVLHHLLTARTIFEGRRVLEALANSKPNNPDWLEIESEQAIPIPLRNVLINCLALESSARIQRAGTLAEVLSDVEL